VLFWNGAVQNLDFRGTKIRDSINVLIGYRKSYVAIRTFAGTNPMNSELFFCLMSQEFCTVARLWRGDSGARKIRLPETRGM